MYIFEKQVIEREKWFARNNRPNKCKDHFSISIYCWSKLITKQYCLLDDFPNSFVQSIFLLVLNNDNDDDLDQNLKSINYGAQLINWGEWKSNYCFLMGGKPNNHRKALSAVWWYADSLTAHPILHGSQVSVLVTVLQINKQRQTFIWVWGAGMAQWWEHSPSTNVARVRFPDSASYVGWVCWFSTLHRDVFSGYSGFPSPQKPKFDLICVNLLIFQFTVSPISALRR